MFDDTAGLVALEGHARPEPPRLLVLLPWRS